MSEDKGVPDIAAGMSAAVAAEPVPAVPATAGEILRAAREAQGLHLAVLAASLKVAPRKLELIESNRHDELADATFARALALSMCRALKIDAEPVLARLPQPAGQRLEQISSGLNQPFRDRPGRHDGSAEWELPSLPVIAALLLALAALAVYLLPTGSWSPVSLLPAWPQNASAPAASAPQSAAPEPVTAVPAAAVAAVPTAPAAEAAASAVPAAASALVETVFSAPAESAASAPVAGGVLRLRASAESWVEVRDAAGQILLSRNLAPGEVAGIDGALPLRLTIGNAEATEVLFRGQPVVLKPARDNVARLELK